MEERERERGRDTEREREKQRERAFLSQAVLFVANLADIKKVHF